MYLDANFFVFALLDTTYKGVKARKIQSEIIKGKKAITSVLALDEIMWVLIKNKKSELLRMAIEDIYSFSNLTIKEVSSLIPLIAIDFIEKYNLKPRDAFHAAIMKDLGITQIVSDDPHFDKIEWIKRIKL